MEWKEFDKYKINEYGDVFYEGILIKPYKTHYVHIRLLTNIDGLNGITMKSLKGKVYKLHRLVYTLFIGIIPENYIIHHIDDNKYNNHYSNLECMKPELHTAHHRTNITTSIENYHPIKKDILTKEYYKEYHKNYQREYNKIGKGKEYRDKYKELNKEKAKEYAKIHYQNNITEMREKQKNYMKMYRKNKKLNSGRQDVQFTHQT